MANSFTVGTFIGLILAAITALVFPPYQHWLVSQWQFILDNPLWAVVFVFAGAALSGIGESDL